MSDKKIFSSTSKVPVLLWFVVGVLCLGEFIRVELILSEHRSRLDKIEEKTDGNDGAETSDVKNKHIKDSFDLKFPRRSTADYLIIKGIPPMAALTFCYWMKTADTSNDGTVVSYAANGIANQFVLLGHKNMKLFISDEDFGSTGVSASDDRWHHICATWGNTAGSWILYKDGTAVKQGSDRKKGQVIPGGGTLILGQDQDVEGGDFELSQAFIGEFSSLNIWNRVLGPSEISQMSRDCRSGEGNVLRWSDVIAGSFRGQVQIIRQSFCR